ncbi:MAG: OsmC family protein [Saprospiraceae bacterium]|nr:OsmC family protein [Saprospiraceae bacterium]
MTATVQYLGDLRTECLHLRSDQSFVTDAPPDNQGKGEAFSPTDLCATSLATCILTTMAIRARDLDITGANAEVNKIMSADPRRISRIEVKIKMPKNNFSDKDKKVLEAIARTCPVALSLSEKIEQAIAIEW